MIWLDEGGQQRHLRLIAAPPALCDFVEHFWIQKTTPKNMWRIVPDLNSHVIFSITDGLMGLTANCCIVGARSTFFDVDAAGRVLTIGARLRPGVLPQLARDSAAQFTDRSVPLEDIAGRSGSRLVEQMIETSPRDAVERLAQFLSRRLDSATAPRPADWLHTATSVIDLAQALRMPRRSAYNRLSATVGLAPKLALRIHRLHQALFALNKGGSLVDAAAGAGYSDQAHFTRETVRLLGEPPGAWRRRCDCSFVQDSN